MNTYLFPINSSSLAHYFGCACIKAAKYFDNKPQDIQDRFRDFLLLTNKKGTVETDCCLELVFTEDETKDLIDLKNGWFLFDTKPLPITRIKKIYFSNEEQKDITITNITMSTAYVPKGLVEICDFDDNRADFIQVPDDCCGIDQTNKINLYDRFLGALALMRLAHEPYMNYSQNYIATLSFFNTEIEKQLKPNERLSYNKNYRGIFSNNNGFEKILPYLNQHINEEVLNEIAHKNNQIIIKDKITRIIDVESFNDTWTYTIAILNSYGVGAESRKQRVDGLIQSHFSSLKEDKQEGVALCYGYNRGYSVFTKDYGIDNKVSYKYKLQSQLDYYTIESVYQYVFNGVVSSGFPYLDSWCPKLTPKPSKIGKDYVNYVILDEVIIGKKELYDTSKERLSKTEKQNRTPQNELKSNTIPNYQRYQSEPNLSQSVVAEPVPDYGTTNSREENLKIAVIKYQDYTLGQLKTKMKKQKQKANDDTKLGDLLHELMNNNELF